ncbi:PTS glucitol/sorbitol transporter subunit IIA [Gallibacterium melopsittaci]|uniref:PTS glucitol/sorbitol transporter subunit IIA n=1 Tax=Gallibacterium melopsittaci TaxID=516063 RepID=A0ABV6HV26_9PAST
MTLLYQTTFKKIGRFAREALEENMLITFKEGAPADLEDYCFIHSHGELQDDVNVGDIVKIDQTEFIVTAVGEVASFNLKQLGHITFRFDSAAQAEYPGTIHLQGEVPQQIDVNSVLTIIRN